jgi:hypothetical protein
MSKKRFTDAEKWRDPWFRDLPEAGKIAWLYLCDSCDAAGVWLVDHAGYHFETGLEQGLHEVFQMLDGRVRVMDADHWHIIKFVEFQYPNGLNPKSDAQKRVIALLNKHGLPLPGTSHPTPTKLGRTSQQEAEEEADSDKEADSERAAPPTTSLPLSETRPGVLELRDIHGLKQPADPRWPNLVRDTSLTALVAARDELVASGKPCWFDDVAAAALRIHRAKRRAMIDQRAQGGQQSAKAEQSKAIEAARVQQREEAIAFLREIEEAGCLANYDPTALDNLRKAIAFNGPGSPPIGGPVGPLAILKRSFKEVASETQAG